MPKRPFIEVGWKPKEVKLPPWRYLSKKHIKTDTVRFLCLRLGFFFVQVNWR